MPDGRDRLIAAPAAARPWSPPGATGPRPAAPRRRGRRRQVARADVLDLVRGPVRAGEPHERDAPAVGVADLLAELRRRGGDVGGDASGPQGGGHAVAGGAVLLVRDGDEHGGGHRAAGRRQAVTEHAGQQPGDADGQSDTGVGALAVGGEGVVPPARADRAEVLVADQRRLVDAARVVVEPAGDLEVRDHRAGRALLRGLQQRHELAEPLVQQRRAGAEREDPVGHRGVGAAYGRELEGLRGLRRGGAGLRLQGIGDAPGADLVELVDHAQGGLDVLEADGLVEALGHLAVVDADPHGRDRQGGQRLGHHQGQLDLVVEGQRVGAHDVDVRLAELAEPAVLGALAPPDLLDLVALERERELAGVLEHVAGEGHGQVEVQAELAVGVGPLRRVLLLEPPEQVDLLGGLALAEQLRERLDGAGLDAREAVELEGAAQRVEDVLLDHAAVGQPLGESGQRRRTYHGADPPIPGPATTIRPAVGPAPPAPGCRRGLRYRRPSTPRR